MLKAAVRSAFTSLFHPREIVVHDARGVRHIRISTRVQVTLAGVTAAVMGWTLAATATVAFGAGDLSARDAEIAERDRKIAAMQADVPRIRKAADEVAERVEMRQETLAGLLSGDGEPVNMSALLHDDPRWADGSEGKKGGSTGR